MPAWGASSRPSGRRFSAVRTKSDFLARQFLPNHFWREELAEAVHENHNALVIGQVALGTAVSDLVRTFGIEPQAVSGYSLGESAGLFSFGAWQDRDGMAAASARFDPFHRGAGRSLPRGSPESGASREELVDWRLGLVAAPAAEVQKGAGRVSSASTC